MGLDDPNFWLKLAQGGGFLGVVSLILYAVATERWVPVSRLRERDKAIEAITAERDEWIERYFALAGDTHRAIKVAETAVTTRARKASP